MEIEQALEFLGLSPQFSSGDLNSNFRTLAKKYHPDFNRGNEQWAHRKMTQLNLAYEAALKYFTSQGEGTDGGGRKTVKSAPVPYSARFNQALYVVLGGIQLFYEYGLENVHLRREGVRKFRYRESLRQVQRGIKSLVDLKAHAVLNRESENLDLCIDFSKAFLQNMLIEKYFVPSGITSEHRAYRHYSEGSSALDYAIKDAFFGDRLIRIRSGSFYQKISLSYEEFFVIVARYQKSSWVPEALLKIYLIEMLTRVIRLLRNMRY